jgi:histone H3/H4
MKLTIHKKTLVKMLKVISGGGVKKDAHLRIAAQDGRVTLTTEDLNEAICHLKHSSPKPLATLVLP